MPDKKPVVLLILDGLGIDIPNEGNAVTKAKTPVLDSLWPIYPHSSLQASEKYVGLPNGVKGNSEVGHMSLGAGRIIYQEIARIDNAIETGDFFQNPTFLEAVNHAKQHNSRIHFMGVVSDGRVHASQDHLHACLKLCNEQQLASEQVKVHAFTDGRDTAPDSSSRYLAALEAEMESLGIGQIASIVGRYYAMDRDERWERTQMAYDLIVHGQGTAVNDWRSAIEHAYQAGQTDEFVQAYVIQDQSGQPVGHVQDNDAVIFFNYRADRAVQLSKAFETDGFDGWQVQRRNNLFFAGFSNYQKGIPMARAEEDVTEAGDESALVQSLLEEDMKSSQSANFPARQIFPPEQINKSLGKVVAELGMTQLRLAESEKYPHVTYFFNCRHTGAHPGENRIEIPSPRDVATYDLKPEMSTYEIAQQGAAAITSGDYDFILINYALTDMVAHTGNLDASIRAVEIADECTGKLVEAVKQVDGKMLITADHGNIEELINMQTGDPDTEHSLNPVPLIMVSNRELNVELPMGMLADIAPTVLAMLGLEKPEEMTGRNLLESYPELLT